MTRGLVLALAILTSPAHAQGMSCMAMPVGLELPDLPGDHYAYSTLPVFAAALSRFDASWSLPSGALALIVLPDGDAVAVLFLRPGFLCRGPPVSATSYEQARRLVAGIEG